MTIENQIHAIQGLGYSRSEAAFLRVVALHSGYFVRRQFLRWLGRGRGKRSQVFIRKLIDRGHACREIFREDRHLFRLQSKVIYEAVGDENNRNRREHQPSTVRVRLMGVDFIIDHREHTYLAAQQEQLTYFVDQRGLDPQTLPVRLFRSNEAVTIRYFPEGSPIFIDREKPDRVTFVYVDDDQLSADAFGSYLRNHKELFQALKAVDLIFLTNHSTRFEAAQRTFERFLRSAYPRLENQFNLTRLLAHFPYRLLHEKRATRDLNTVEINTLQRDLHELVDARVDHLYSVWKQSGNEGVRATWAADNSATALPEIHLQSCVLSYDYDLFGTLHADV